MKKKGFSLVEVVVSIGIFSLIIFSVAQVFITSKEAARIGIQKTEAETLVLEYLEELKNLRRASWDNLTNGRFIIAESLGNLILQSTESGEEINGFTRYLEIEDGYRDESGNLVDQGGALDPSTKKATVFVSWTGFRPGTFSQSTYFTRYLENMVWQQTTDSDFSAGELEYVEIVSPMIDDGEVQLQGGCEENPAGAWIYDESFQNGWEIHPSAKGDIDEVTQITGEVYEGEKALALSSFAGTSTKLRNSVNICTLGFTRVEFYAYNSATVSQSFQIGGKWEQQFAEIVLPPQSWEFISLPYGDVSSGDEVNFDFIFYKEGNFQPGTIFYIDNFTLDGGIGGYYQVGTLTSQVFDTGKQSAFNRISFNGLTPPNTQIGMQTAVSDDPLGPWIFYGPGGTGLEDDLYLNPEGEGIWLGANLGRYFRYKAYLKTTDGEETPILYDVSVNYSP